MKTSAEFKNTRQFPCLARAKTANGLGHIYVLFKSASEGTTVACTHANSNANAQVGYMGTDWTDPYENSSWEICGPGTVITIEV